jgi:hypothetical protein
MRAIVQAIGIDFDFMQEMSNIRMLMLFKTVSSVPSHADKSLEQQRCYNRKGLALKAMVVSNL